MYYCYSLSLHFYNSLLDWKFVSFATAYRYCSLCYKIAQRKKSMSAVQLPQEFTISVCYVTLAPTALALTPTSLYPRCFSATWCSWASCCWQLTSFPAKHTDRICDRVRSFVTAGLWPRSGYRGRVAIPKIWEGPKKFEEAQGAWV